MVDNFFILSGVLTVMLICAIIAGRDYRKLELEFRSCQAETATY